MDATPYVYSCGMGKVSPSRRTAGVLLALAFFAGCGDGGGGGGTPAFTDIGAELTNVDWCSLAWGDYDSDGDLDLALAGSSSSTKVYCNDSGTFTDAGAALPGVLFCSVAWGDYDNDSDLDLALAGAVGGSNVYRNGGGTFTDVGAGLTGVSHCSLAWGDCDNDGDLDFALAGSTGSTNVSNVYRNDAGTFTDIGAGLTGVLDCSLAWGDYDNDGDLDLALAGGWHDGTSWHYESKVYRNGGGTFTDTGAALTGVSLCSLAWGDYDNDGDLDLALAGYSASASSSISRIYRSDGGTFTDAGAGLLGVCKCSLAWGDYDSDGDLDLALAGADFSGNAFSKIYRNDGGTFTDIGAGLTGVYLCSLAWGDYDNDGDLDLVLAGHIGGGDRTSKVYRNDGGAFNTPPAAPGGLSASYTGPGPYDVTFSWIASTDTETPQDGLSYNLRVGTATGKDDLMPGMSTIGGANDGKRLIPAMGNVQHNTSWTLRGLASGSYYWSVQAVDTAFCGSPWAPEQTVVVP